MSWFDNHYAPAYEQEDLRLVLQRLGVVITGDKALATWRGEKTPSVHVYADHWHDYGGDQRGDLLDWLEVAEGMGKDEARAEAARILGIPAPGASTTGRIVSRGATMPPLPDFDPEAHKKPKAETESKNWIEDLTAQAHAALKHSESEAAKRARAYLESRGLSTVVDIFRLGVVDESVKVQQAGQYIDGLRGRLLVPTLQGGVASFYNARDLTDKDPIKYKKPKGITTPAPFNADALEEARALGFLVLTEGELDAASIQVAKGQNYPVLGLSGGLLPEGWAERIKETGARAYVLFDNDDSGREKAERLQATLAGQGIKTFVARYPAPHKDANEALVTLDAQGLAVALDRALEESEAAATSDLLYIRDTWLAELDARANRPHSAYTTGLELVDELLGGGYIEGLHLLGAITGGGKTSYALHIAMHNALAGRSVIFGSYEQSRLELWARIASSITGVPYGAIKRGTYDRHGHKVLTSGELRASEGWERLEQVARHLKVVEGGDAFSRTEGSYTVEVLTRSAEAIAEERGAPPLVIVDYLQRVPIPTKEKATVRERLDYVAGQLQQNVARGVGCPVLAISSINRINYQALPKEALESRLTAFKESGGLEYTAYTAALLYKLPPEKHGTNFSPSLMSKFEPMVVDFVKNREGTTDRYALKWNKVKGTWFDAQKYGSDRDLL